MQMNESNLPSQPPAHNTLPSETKDKILQIAQNSLQKVQELRQKSKQDPVESKTMTEKQQRRTAFGLLDHHAR